MNFTGIKSYFGTSTIAEQTGTTPDEALMFGKDRPTSASKNIVIKLPETYLKEEPTTESSKYSFVNTARKAVALFKRLVGTSVQIGSTTYTKTSLTQACFIKFLKTYIEPSFDQLNHKLNWEKDKEIFAAVVKAVNKNLKYGVATTPLKISSQAEGLIKQVADDAFKMVRKFEVRTDHTTYAKKIDNKVVAFVKRLFNQAVKIGNDTYDLSSLYQAKFVEKIQTESKFVKKGKEFFHLLNWESNKNRFIASVKAVTANLKTFKEDPSKLSGDSSLEKIIGRGRKAPLSMAPTYSGL